MSRSNDAYAWAAHYNVDRSYTIDGLNRIMNIGSTAFAYDGRGNLTSDGTNAFTYTSENLLKTGPGGTTLAYDPLGRLYETVKSPTTTHFLYDGADRIGEYDGSNAVQRRYVRGPGIDNPIAWYEGSAISSTTRRFLMADERGSVVSITDSAGATIAINAYDEYGIPAPGNVGKFGYTGQTWLPEVGMWHYKARMYSPTLGRFMQTDPIGYADGMNWYNYVGSDPVNFSDPTGLSCVQVLSYSAQYYDKNHNRRRDPNEPHIPGTNEETGRANVCFGDLGLQGFGGGGGGGGGPMTVSGVIICPPVTARLTGVGPNQANSANPTSISQTPGNQIPDGGVAIDPSDFGVPNARGAARDVFRQIRIAPIWSSAVPPSNGAPAIPNGLPSQGPYRVMDVIGPASVRNQPGFHIDLYRYSDQKEAFSSTRTISVVVFIPQNSAGVTCPTGE